MGKIYEPNTVSERIDAIIIEADSSNEITYTQTLCDPRFRKATFVGCSLAVL